MKKYDVIIIGWGKGGKTLANKLGLSNKKVAIIEKDPKMVGGTCINVGCLPTKSYTHYSHVFVETSKLGYKTSYETGKKAYVKTLKHKLEFVKKLNQKNFELLNKNKNVDIYMGSAKFLSDYEVEVNLNSNKKKVKLTAKNIIIGTGSVSRKLNIEGAAKSRFVKYSNDILNLRTLPKKLLVVGAGFIGLEFASYFANFGTQVTVAQYNNDFMPNEDKEDSKFILDTLKKQGIKFEFNTTCEKFKDLKSQVQVSLSNKTKKYKEKFDAVLISAGRIPNTLNLGLENTKIKVLDNKAIEVNKYLQTNVKGIYAIGDVKGGPMFTYISLDDYRIVSDQLLKTKKNRNLDNRPLVPTNVFIRPSFARVGLNLKQAKELNLQGCYAKTILTSSIPKAHVINELEGFNKLIFNKQNQLIGVSLFSYVAHEIVNVFSLMIQNKMTFEEIKDYIYSHPVYTEMLNDL